MKNSQAGLLPSDAGILLADLRQPNRQFISAGERTKLNLFRGNLAQPMPVAARRDAALQAEFRCDAHLGRGAVEHTGQVSGQSWLGLGSFFEEQ